MDPSFAKSLKNLGKVSDQEDYQFEMRKAEIKPKKFQSSKSKSNTSSFKKSGPNSFVSENPIPE